MSRSTTRLTISSKKLYKENISEIVNVFEGEQRIDLANDPIDGVSGVETDTDVTVESSFERWLRGLANECYPQIR